MKSFEELRQLCRDCGYTAHAPYSYDSSTNCSDIGPGCFDIEDGCPECHSKDILESVELCDPPESD